MSIAGLPSLSPNLLLLLLPLSVALPSLVLWLQPEGLLCCPFLILHTQWPDSVCLHPKYLYLLTLLLPKLFLPFFWIAATKVHALEHSCPSPEPALIKASRLAFLNTNRIIPFLSSKLFCPQESPTLCMSEIEGKLPPPPSITYIHTVGRSICIVFWFWAQPLSHLIILASFNCLFPHKMVGPHCDVFELLVLLPSHPSPLKR